MTSVNFNIQSVANVVHSWMSYIYEVSDTKHLAAESSLRYPIVGYFERCSNIEILMEEDLPSFSGKRVDLMWTDKESKINYYMEMKYVRDSSINVQGIYDDIFRLALIDDDNSEKYLMLCGEIVDFDSKIFQKERKPYNIDEEGKIILPIQSYGAKQKKFNEILSFAAGEKASERKKAIKVKTYYASKVDDRFSTFINNEKYYPKEKRENAPKRIRISTELVQPYSKGLKSAVAIWRINTIYLK